MCRLGRWLSEQQYVLTLSFIFNRIKRDEGQGIEMSHSNYNEYESWWRSNMNTHHVSLSQEKPRKSKVNTMDINQTLTIKSEPETNNMKLESPEVRIRWVLIVDGKFLNITLWHELKGQVKDGMFRG